MTRDWGVIVNEREEAREQHYHPNLAERDSTLRRTEEAQERTRKARGENENKRRGEGRNSPGGDFPDDRVAAKGVKFTNFLVGRKSLLVRGKNPDYFSAEKVGFTRGDSK